MAINTKGSLDKSLAGKRGRVDRVRQQIADTEAAKPFREATQAQRRALVAMCQKLWHYRPAWAERLHEQAIAGDLTIGSAIQLHRALRRLLDRLVAEEGEQVKK